MCVHTHGRFFLLVVAVLLSGALTLAKFQSVGSVVVVVGVSVMCTTDVMSSTFVCREAAHNGMSAVCEFVLLCVYGFCNFFVVWWWRRELLPSE